MGMRKTQNKRRDLRDSFILEVYLKGRNYTMIADDFHLSLSNVHGIVTRTARAVHSFSGSPVLAGYAAKVPGPEKTSFRISNRVKDVKTHTNFFLEHLPKFRQGLGLGPEFGLNI
jgi:hypothetical protein